MKLRRAATGHRSLSVRPRCMVTPNLNGSVFDALIRMATVDGAAFESTETSAMDRGRMLTGSQWWPPWTAESRRNRHTIVWYSCMSYILVAPTLA